MKIARNHPLCQDWKKVTCCTRWTHDLWHHQPFVQVISAALQQWPCVRATLFYALPVFVYVAKGSLNQPNILVLNLSIHPCEFKKATSDQIRGSYALIFTDPSLLGTPTRLAVDLSCLLPFLPHGRNASGCQTFSPHPHVMHVGVLVREAGARKKAWVFHCVTVLRWDKISSEKWQR